MALRLNGSNTGYVELDVPADAGSHTLTLPDGGGTSGQYLQTNGSGGLSWQTVTDSDTFGLTHLTSVSTSSVSEVTFTGIPSTATVVYVNVYNLGTTVNNASRLEMQVGNGSIDSGANRYKWQTSYVTVSNGCGAESNSGDTKYRVFHGGISGTGHRNVGTIQLLRTNDSGWVITSQCGDTSGDPYMLFSAGMYTEHTAIDRVRLFNASGDNFSNSSLLMVSYQ